MRRAHLRTAAMITGLALASSAEAQAPLRGDEPMPPGHPPVGAASPDPAPASPDAPPKDAPQDANTSPGASARPRAGAPGSIPSPSPSAATSSAAMPPGHPPTTGHPPTDGSPLRGAPPPDRVIERSDLPAGTVIVELRRGNGEPLPGHPFELVQHEHNVAEGDRIERLSGKTDDAGQARFDDLPRTTSYSYSVVAKQGPATYRSEEFQLHKGGGRHALTHVFPVVRDLNEALIGLRGIVFIEPRVDIVQIEISFQVFNIGRTTWVPNDVTFPLPASASAFRVRDTEAESRFEQRGDRVAIVGTYGPGQKEIAFSYQVPSTGASSQTLDLHLPPRVAQLRVAAAIGRDAELRVAGFNEAQHMRGNDGSWIALTGRQMGRGDGALDRLSIVLEGLHTPSQGRWVALGLALSIAGMGLAFAVSRRRSAQSNDDTERAMGLLFAELEALEKLRKADKIGPRTYERARSTLIDALTRLEASRDTAAGPGAPSPA